MDMTEQQKTYHRFLAGTKYITLGSIAVLAGMALFLL